jgi:predicted glutamine amidotransferase
MCVIIKSPNRKHRPSIATLRACERQNPHGGGVAWIHGDKVHFAKGLSADEIHQVIARQKGEVVIHFRWATVGDKIAKLCHPFPVSCDSTPREVGDEPKVLFHNGHWSGWEEFLTDNDIKLSGPVSDTRVAAIATYLGGAEFLKSIPGRFVLMTPQGSQLFGDWEKRDGMEFSNLHWSRRLSPAKATKPVKSTARRVAKSAQPGHPELWPTPPPISRPSNFYTGRRNVRDAMICYGD